MAFPLLLDNFLNFGTTIESGTNIPTMVVLVVGAFIFFKFIDGKGGKKK